MPRGGSIINIAGTTPVDDPEYRYKMPAVFGKIEGSGNGIKTAIPNISDVATSLHRQPAEVNKFFGTELGAQTRYNPDTDRAIVNGAHTDMVLQDLMHRYIEKFVLCPNCRLPETDYKIKNGAIFHRCKACGSKEMVDMSHKLCTFILKEAKTAKKDKKNNDDNNNNKKKSKKDKKDKDSDGSEKDVSVTTILFALLLLEFCYSYYSDESHLFTFCVHRTRRSQRKTKRTRRRIKRTRRKRVTVSQKKTVFLLFSTL